MRKEEKDMNKVNHPFWVIVNKEISDHVKSWRFIILIGIIALTCMGSLYTALTNISEAIKPNDPDGSFLFLKLFTVSDGTLPSFVLFINFLGPLLGIALESQGKTANVYLSNDCGFLISNLHNICTTCIAHVC